jgi:hypothetical protein
MSLTSDSELGEWGEGDTTAGLGASDCEAGCVVEPATPALAGAARFDRELRITPHGVTLTLFL